MQNNSFYCVLSAKAPFFLLLQKFCGEIVKRSPSARSLLTGNIKKRRTARGAPGENSMNFLTVLESIGVFAFAVSGADVAIQKNMDLFGIYTLATVTAMGGGITRDVVMSRGVPVFFSSYRAVLIIFFAATLVMLLRSHAKKWATVITVMDAIGLAIFTIDTAIKALASGYNLLAFLFVSVITAVGGGVIRDVLCSRVPLVLRREIYATASLAGALVFWWLHRFIGVMAACYVCIVLIILFRLATVYFSVNLPKMKQGDSGKEAGA